MDLEADGQVKKLHEMSKEELDGFEHTPDIQLSLAVFRAKDSNKYDELINYLQVADFSLFGL